MRLFAAASLTGLAMLASTAQTHAMPRPAGPGAGGQNLTLVNGDRHYYGHHHGHHWHAYGHARGYYYLMYAVHNYPRGISATFGAPRCCCYCRRDW
jgi:hypothetical protein